MPDGPLGLGMTKAAGVIPSERSESRESSCIAADARRHYVLGMTEFLTTDTQRPFSLGLKLLESMTRPFSCI